MSPSYATYVVSKLTKQITVKRVSIQQRNLRVSKRYGKH